jgi:hypothetical protein
MLSTVTAVAIRQVPSLWQQKIRHGEHDAYSRRADVTEERKKTRKASARKENQSVASYKFDKEPPLILNVEARVSLGAAAAATFRSLSRSVNLLARPFSRLLISLFGLRLVDFSLGEQSLLGPLLRFVISQRTTVRAEKVS